MATSARIEELKKKFDENPRRYFAPLANEFRKMGDFDQAILICQEFLPQQPGHMSGHIVYGQALFEARKLDEARGVFETALSLDPENLIALRHLGDICREHGDIEGARGWYRRVLEADPRNEEIASVLAALDEPTAVPWTTPTPRSVPSVPEDTGAPASEPVVEQPLQTAPPEKAIVDFHDMLLRAAEEAPLGSSASAAPSGSEPAHEAEAIDLDVSDFAAGARPSVVDDLQLERSVDTPFGFETSPALHDESAASVLPDGERTLPEQPEATPVQVDAQQQVHETTPVSAEVQERAPEAPPAEVVTPPTAHPAVPEAQPTGAPEFVTETMAELYVQQGHLVEAVGVYRQLVVRYPGDEVLRARLEELESARREAESHRPTPPARPTPEAAIETPVQEHRAPETPPAPVMPARTPPSHPQFSEPEPPDGQHETVASSGTEPETAASPGDSGGARLLDDLAIDEAFVESTLAPAATGTTIRDFLAELARKRPPATNGSEPSGGAPRHREPEPEQEGPEADFEAAAARFADIPGAPRIDDFDEVTPADAQLEHLELEPPPGRTPSQSDALSTIGGSIDVLFSGAGTTTADEEAASTLASAFPSDAPGEELGGKPARRAQDELSLDHVFRERGGTERSQSSFSFDQFFAQGTDRGPGGAEQPGAEGEENDDDIQQFNAWLEGLKKT